MKRTTWAAGAAVLAAVGLATAVTTGCSAGNDTSSSTVSQAEESAKSKAPAAKTATEQAGVAPTASPTGPATLSVHNTGLGKTMVGEKGFTVYLFLADTTSKSTCTGACAAAWPPVTTVGEPKAGQGVGSGVKLGTSKRADGSTQVTVNGHPVYYFAGDKKAGDTAGQGLNQFGAKWWALDAAGKTITKMTSASPSASGSASPTATNTGSGGGGY